MRRDLDRWSVQRPVWAMRQLGPATVLLAAFACSPPPTPPAEPGAPAPRAEEQTSEPARSERRRPALLEPPTFAEVGGACRVGEHVAVGETQTDPRVYGVAVFAGPDGALVVWRSGEDEVSARAVDARGRPRGEVRHATLGNPHILRGAAQPDGTFVVLGSPYCPAGSGVHDRCLAARTFAADGTPLDPVATANVGPRDFGHPWAHASLRGAVALVQPSILDQGTPLLVRFEPHDGAASTIALSEVPVEVPRSEGARLDGFAVDASGDAVIALRSVAGDVLLREGRPPEPIAGLPPAAGRVDLAVDGERVLAAFDEGPGLSRAVAVQLGAEPARVAVADRYPTPLPAPFDRVRVRADVGMGGCLHVGRSVPGWGSLRDSVIHVWDCRDSDRPPAGRGVAWTGHGFLAAHGRHADGRWIIRVTPIDCDPPR